MLANRPRSSTQKKEDEVGRIPSSALNQSSLNFSGSPALFSLDIPVLHRGMPSELQGYYNHYVVEAIQALTRGWYDDQPLYPGWESTGNFRDTGEAAGLVTSRRPDQARKELEQLSEVCPGLEEGESEDEGSDDEGGAPRGVPAERWGTLDGLTPSER